jgi:hypothetical protein
MLPGDIALADRNLMNFVRRWMNFPDISNQQNRVAFWFGNVATSN